MRGLEQVRKEDPKLADKILENGGFITTADLPRLIEINRLMLILVRCGNGRFMTPAQDVEHFVTIIDQHRKMLEAAGVQFPGDYVRDLSLPA